MRGFLRPENPHLVSIPECEIETKKGSWQIQSLYPGKVLKELHHRVIRRIRGFGSVIHVDKAEMPALRGEAVSPIHEIEPIDAFHQSLGQDKDIKFHQVLGLEPLRERTKGLPAALGDPDGFATVVLIHDFPETPEFPEFGPGAPVLYGGIPGMATPPMAVMASRDGFPRA